MANFEKSIILVLKNEGGYNRNLGDGAGRTYRGLTEKYDPNFNWQYIYNKEQQGKIKEETIFPELENQVKDYYKNKYWQICKGEELKSQAVADFLLSFCVMSGNWAKIVNKSINQALGQKLVNEDSILTAKAVQLLNSNSAKIYPIIYENRLKYYQSLPLWEKFKNGWLRMFSLYPKAIVQSSSLILIAVIGLIYFLFFRKN